MKSPRTLSFFLSLFLMLCPHSSPESSPLPNWSISFSPYTISVDNSDTNNIKTDSTIYGLYGYFGFDKHSLELEYDSVRSRTHTQLQYNILTLYTNYQQPGYRFNFGYHFIDAHTATFDKVNIGILGIHRDKYTAWGYFSWSLGAHVYASHYSSTTKDQILLTQISPYFKSILPSSHIPGFAYLTTRYNAIVHATDFGYGMRNFGSLDFILDWVIDKWTLTGKLWIGEASGAVYDGGYIVYNTSDRLTEGVGLWVLYVINPKMSAKIGYSTRTAFTSNSLEYKMERISAMINIQL